MITKILLSNGGFVIIDNRDLERVAGYNWYKVKSRNTYYARAHVPGSGKPGTKVYMHHLIICALLGKEVDHRDRDGLNNCRGNLRRVSRSVNRSNSKLYKNNKTGFRGVHMVSSGYVAMIRRNGKSIYLGTFSTPEEAAGVYNRARHIHG